MYRWPDRVCPADHDTVYHRLPLSPLIKDDKEPGQILDDVIPSCQPETQPSSSIFGFSISSHSYMAAAGIAARQPTRERSPIITRVLLLGCLVSFALLALTSFRPSSTSILASQAHSSLSSWLHSVSEGLVGEKMQGKRTVGYFVSAS